jgi:hypothetical protein
LSNSLKSLHAFRPVPPRRAVAAPTKNIENNPMQSNRRLPQGLDRKLDTSGKSAAQFHDPGIC